MQQPAVYLMASAALVIVSTTFSLSLSQLKVKGMILWMLVEK